MGSTRLGIDVPHLVTMYQQGKLKLDELITDHFVLDDINEAIELVEQGKALRGLGVAWLLSHWWSSFWRHAAARNGDAHLLADLTGECSIDKEDKDAVGRCSHQRGTPCQCPQASRGRVGTCLGGLIAQCVQRILVQSAQPVCAGYRNGACSLR